MKLALLPFCMVLHLFTATALVPPTSNVIRLHLPYNRTSNSSSQLVGPIPPRPVPPHEIDAVTCIKRPKMTHINPETCTQVFGALATAPTAKELKRYSRGTTSLGWSPCHLDLKKARGGSAIELTLEHIVNAANAVLIDCARDQGAGWVHLYADVPWYILVYGDLRSETPMPLSNDTTSSVDTSTA